MYDVDEERAGECDSRDVCYPFLEVFDSVHVWTYFLVPLAFAECIVRSLPSAAAAASAETSSEDAANNQKDAAADHGDDEDPPAEENDSPPPVYSYARLNSLGIAGAGFAIGSTVLICTTSFLGTNAIST